MINEIWQGSTKKQDNTVKLKFCYCLLFTLVFSGASVIFFSFDVGSERMELSVRSPVPLNDDQWHRVEAEKNIKEAALQLNGQYREIRPTPSKGHKKLEFYSELYVGKRHTKTHINRAEGQSRQSWTSISGVWIMECSDHQVGKRFIHCILCFISHIDNIYHLLDM